MKFQGDSLEILAEVVDKAKPVLLESQIHRVWTEDALPGFSFEESQVFLKQKTDGNPFDGRKVLEVLQEPAAV